MAKVENQRGLKVRRLLIRFVLIWIEGNLCTDLFECCHAAELHSRN